MFDNHWLSNLKRSWKKITRSESPTLCFKWGFSSGQWRSLDGL